MLKYPIKYIIRLALKVCTYILYALTLLTAYGGYVNPEWMTLPSMGVILFPYFAMSSLVLAIGWLISRRFFIGCVGIGVLLLSGPTFTDALPLRFHNKASNPTRTFKMVTFNCLHLSDQKNDTAGGFNRSLHFLIHSGADFICLQELYDFKRNKLNEIFKNQVDSLLNIYPYISTDGNREIEFISKYPFRQIPVKLGNDIKYGSVAAYMLEVDGQPLTIVNVHLSSYMLTELERNVITEAHSKTGVKKSIKQLEGSVYRKMRDAFKMRAKVSGAIAEFAGNLAGNVIVCGDFNDVPGSWTYRNFTRQGFRDAYAQTGFGHMITYNQHMMLFHIDQVLYKGDLMPLYVSRDGLNASDHYPLTAEFEFI